MVQHSLQSKGDAIRRDGLPLARKSAVGPRDQKEAVLCCADSLPSLSLHHSLEHVPRCHEYVLD